MGRGAVLSIGCAAAMLVATSARAEHTLTADELQAEMSRNQALAAYVARNGMPDVAESHLLADRPPWDDHEVTCYYLDRRQELGFARAFVLDRPEVQIMRYQRPMTDAQVAAISSRPRLARAGSPMLPPGSDPASRAEAAALRAEDAADRIEAQVASVEGAADRAEAAAAHGERGFHRALQK